MNSIMISNSSAIDLVAMVYFGSMTAFGIFEPYMSVSSCSVVLELLSIEGASTFHDPGQFNCYLSPPSLERPLAIATEFYSMSAL